MKALLINPSKYWNGFNPKWSHVAFEHPASFDTLAIDAKRKEEIVNDLNTFKEGREYIYHVYDLNLTTMGKMMGGLEACSVVVVDK
ncbi:hypothetical protein GQ457_06G025650 [Hibiscus cannabinus]